MASKYTRRDLQQKVKKAISLADLVRMLGVNPEGGSRPYVRQLIRDYQIDTQHWNSRGKPPVFKRKIPYQEILVKNRIGNYREPPRTLRRAMLEAGAQHVCAGCGLGPVWQGYPIQLQIDHLNGDCKDNRKKNLRFLCPNCHSQTPTHSMRIRSRTVGSKAAKTVKGSVVRDLGIEPSSNAMS